MINLVSANLERLKKSKSFWIMTLSIVVLALTLLFNQYQEKLDGAEVYFDSLMNSFLVFIGIVISIFTCLFLSAEYANGAIRNKVIIGHKRVHIYMANFLTIVGVGLFFAFLHGLCISVVGIPLFGFSLESSPNFVYALVMTLFIIIANASIYTFISLLCADNVLAAVLCILFAFGSYFATLSLLSVIETPKYVTTTTIFDMETGEVSSQKSLNPNYPSARTRKICQTLMDIIPQSQSIEVATNKVVNKKALPIYSFLTIVLFTGSGCFLFKRKELN